MKRVVIVGGGFAGSIVAKKIENNFDVVLIDDKSYFEFTPGILRVIAHPTKQHQLQYEHTQYLKKAKFLLGKVDSIGEGFVIFKGKKIHYDYLVVATGSSYRETFKHPQMYMTSRARELGEYRHKLAKAKHALIIGGGLVGVELAAEITHYFPELKLTIVHMKDVLLERMSPNAQSYARGFLEKQGVEMVFGEKVARHTGKVFVTDSGRKISADIAFNCGGILPNSKIILKNYKNSVDERGFVRVDEYLRLSGVENVFVAGDVAGIIEEKTAQNAEKQAEVIADNIHALNNGLPLRKYISKKRPIVLSLGPYDGLLVKNDFVMSGLIPAMLKWFVEKKELLKRRF